MISPETPTQPTSPTLQRLGLVGLWLCSALFFPVVVVWADSFGSQQSLRLMHPGTPVFWRIVGLNVFLASMMTFQQWQGNRKPKKRRVLPKPTTSKDRWRPFWAVSLLLGFVVLHLLADNPGASIHWGGAVGGAAALVLLVLLMFRCAKLTVPPGVHEDVAVDTLPLLPPTAPALPLGSRPPKNSHRAGVSGREAVYRQPLSMRVFYGVFGLILGASAFVSEGFALIGLGISVGGIHPHHHNPAMALLMGSGGVFVGAIALSCLLMTGPRELRVSPSDGTYVYRLAAPVQWPILNAVTDRSNRSLLGQPWHIIEYRGKREDMAGVQRLVTNNKSTTTCWLLLCWHDPARPPMQVGFNSDEAKARTLQAQAAEDLGVPLLPDEVV